MVLDKYLLNRMNFKRLGTKTSTAELCLSVKRRVHIQQTERFREEHLRWLGFCFVCFLLCKRWLDTHTLDLSKEVILLFHGRLLAGVN